MRRMKTLPLPRYVDATTVDEGDVIRVTWKVGDLEHTRTGKVGAIHHMSGSRVRLFVTPEGNEIVRYDPQSGAKLRFTLLEEAPTRQPSLFEMEPVNG